MPPLGVLACVRAWPGGPQVYSTNLGQVVDIVVSHQAVALKAALVARLMAALVLPAPEHYRPLLRRLAALGAVSSSTAPSTRTNTVDVLRQCGRHADC